MNNYHLKLLDTTHFGKDKHFKSADEFIMKLQECESIFFYQGFKP